MDDEGVYYCKELYMKLASRSSGTMTILLGKARNIMGKGLSIRGNRIAKGAVWTLLVIAFVFVASGCAKQSFDEEALKNSSLQYMEQFRQANIEDFYSNVSQDVSSQLPKQEFALIVESVLEETGEFENLVDASYIEQDGYGIIVVTEKYEKQTMLSTFAYDKEGKIAGINFQFAQGTEQKDAQSTDEPTGTSAANYEEIAIQVGYTDQKMDGLLTVPRGVNNPPVAILVQGSGPSDKHESIGATPNRPFADLAYGLAEQGIATIRYDKRYFTHQPKQLTDVTVEDEVLYDVRDAIALARSSEQVDSDRIFVIGHSLGGMLAPKIAADNPEVRGITVMAGSLRKLEDIILDQNIAVLEQEASLTDTQKAEMLEQVRSEVQKVKQLAADDKTSLVFNQPASYWNSLNAIDGQAIVRQLDIPILVLQGEMDFQVSSEVDYKLWQTELAGKDNVTFHLYPNLNHLFMPATSKKLDPSVYDEPANVDQQVITDIAKWIKGI